MQVQTHCKRIREAGGIQRILFITCFYHFIFFLNILVIMESNYGPIMETSASMAIVFYLSEGYVFKRPIGRPRFEIEMEK